MRTDALYTSLTDRAVEAIQADWVIPADILAEVDAAGFLTTSFEARAYRLADNHVEGSN